jgi:hypothetical protein
MTPKETEWTIRDERFHLERQYGSIGISAVAAALRYQGEAKNPRYAPAAPKDEDCADVDIAA